MREKESKGENGARREKNNFKRRQTDRRTERERGINKEVFENNQKKTIHTEKRKEG